jgi:DNA-binding XRE family transcriptional regulator
VTNLKTDINTIEIPDEVPTSVLGKSTKPVNDEAVAYYKQVALNMRKARRQLNLTQQQIADAMDIPRSTYKSLESGEVYLLFSHGQMVDGDGL